MPAAGQMVPAATERGVRRCLRLAVWCLRPRNVGFGDACGWPCDAGTHETWGSAMSGTAWVMPGAGRVMPAFTKRWFWRCLRLAGWSLQAGWCLRPQNVGVDAVCCLRARDIDFGDACGWPCGACGHETWGSGLPAAGRVVPAPRGRGVRGCLGLAVWCLRPRSVVFVDACGCPGGACAHETWGLTMPAPVQVLPVATKK